MQQAILLDAGDLRGLKRGGSLRLEVAPGLSVTLLFLSGRVSSNGHASNGAPTPRKSRAIPSRKLGETRTDALGRPWRFTPARQAALKKALRAVHGKPELQRKRVKALRAALAQKAKERANGNG